MVLPFDMNETYETEKLVDGWSTLGPLADLAIHRDLATLGSNKSSFPCFKSAEARSGAISAADSPEFGATVCPPQTRWVDVPLARWYKPNYHCARYPSI